MGAKLGYIVKAKYGDIGLDKNKKYVVIGRGKKGGVWLQDLENGELPLYKNYYGFVEEGQGFPVNAFEDVAKYFDYGFQEAA